MPPINLPIHAGWKPDLALEDISKLGALKIASNIVRTKKYYWPVPSPVVYNNNAMSGIPQSGVIAQASNGSNYNFVGTSTKLYAFNASTMADVTKNGFTGGGTFWSWAVYGKWLIASDYTDSIQVHKDIAAGLGGTKFADLGGSPPKAKFILINHGHLILANLNSGGVTYEKKLQWSARENVEQFTASVTTGADSQECPEIDGVMTGLTGVGDNFAIFSENSISMGYYIGGQYTFSFKFNVIRNIGCAYPGSLISIGGICFFWSKKSLWMFDGNTVTEIGADIKETLFSALNANVPDSISCGHDHASNLIYWAYATGSNTIPNKLLAYNYSENVFTVIDIPSYFVMMAIAGGQLSDQISDLSDNIIMLSDSPFYKANIRQFLICDVNKKMNSLSGTKLTATIETGEVNKENFVLSASRMFVPIDGSSASGTAYIKKRYSLSESQKLSTGRPIRSDGFVDIKTSDRRLACYMTLSNFDKLGNTIDLYAIQTGGR